MLSTVQNSIDTLKQELLQIERDFQAKQGRKMEKSDMSDKIREKYRQYAMAKKQAQKSSTKSKEELPKKSILKPEPPKPVNPFIKPATKPLFSPKGPSIKKVKMNANSSLLEMAEATRMGSPVTKKVKLNDGQPRNFVEMLKQVATTPTPKSVLRVNFMEDVTPPKALRFSPASPQEKPIPKVHVSDTEDTVDDLFVPVAGAGKRKRYKPQGTESIRPYHRPAIRISRPPSTSRPRIRLFTEAELDLATMAKTPAHAQSQPSPHDSPNDLLQSPTHRLKPSEPKFYKPTTVLRSDIPFIPGIQRKQELPVIDDKSDSSEEEEEVALPTKRQEGKKKLTKLKGKDGQTVEPLNAGTGGYRALKVSKYGKKQGKMIAGGRGKFGKVVSSVGSSYNTHSGNYKQKQEKEVSVSEQVFDEKLNLEELKSLRSKKKLSNKFVVEQSNDEMVVKIAQHYLEPNSPPVFVNLKKALTELNHNVKEFRGQQLSAIKSILTGESCLTLMPTGMGKSLVYQLCAYILTNLKPSFVVVVTPTISLMDDQVKNLPSTLPGAVISSSLDNAQDVYQNVVEGTIQIVFITPERLVSTTFMEFCQIAPSIAFACIDEAHCLSEWSHNFRTSYLYVGHSLSKLNVQTTLALTGTATMDIRADIQQQLQITKVHGDCKLRDNLILSCSRNSEGFTAVSQLLTSFPWSELHGIIVYCLRRDQCESLAGHLRTRGISASCYHAGMSANDRTIASGDFVIGKIKVLVATVAYGMGINKTDVRGIIHFSLPKSLESYVQEIGRAGRDGELARCHLFLNKQEYIRLRSFACSDTPCTDAVKSLVKMVFESGHDNVTIPLQEAESIVDAKRDVLLTLLSYMELSEQQWIKLMPLFPTRCKIHLIKTEQEVLTKAYDWMNVICKSGKTSSPVIFEIDTWKASQECNMTPGELLQNLKMLRGQREITFTTHDESIQVNVLKHLKSYNEVVDYLVKKTFKLETIRMQKVDEIYKVMSGMDDLKDPNSCTSNKKMIEEYFARPREQLQGKKQVSRWGFEDAELVEQQKKDLVEVSSLMTTFFVEFPDTFTNGRQVARIWHGLDSPKFPQPEWQEKARDVWGKYKHWNFRELVRMAERNIHVRLPDFQITE